MELLDLETYHLPHTLEEAAAGLAQNEGNMMVLGGGTFVHGLVARGLISHVTSLIDVTRLPLRWVRSERDAVSIGAATTLQTVADQLAAADLPWLGGVADALIYPPAQVRNAATIGGNVAAGCPFFDLPVVLLALGATVQATKVGASREIALQDLYVSLFQTSLDSQEFVTSVTIPRPAARWASAYEKLETNANDLALISVGVAVALDVAGRLAAVRIVAGGGVGEVPVRCVSAEAAAVGQEPDAEAIARAVAAAKAEVDPIGDHRASSAYRRHMVGILLARTLERALGRLK